MINGLLTSSCIECKLFWLHIKKRIPRRHRKMETHTNLKTQTVNETVVRICKNILLIRLLELEECKMMVDTYFDV